MGEIPWSDIDINRSSMCPIFGVWIGTDPWGPEMDHPPLGRSYLVVVPSYDMSCALILLTGLYGWDSMVEYWYQSFIDGSNIWCVDRTDPWGPEMDHPPLGRSYLVVVPSYDMSCALILLTGLYGWDSMVDIDINPSSMGPIFGVWIGPTLGVPKWTICHWAAANLVVVPSYDMSCALILLNWALWVRFHGRYWYQFLSSLGPIFGVWIGPTLGVPKWTIRHWAAAIW